MTGTRENHAHSHHRRGRHGRAQADRAAGRGRRLNGTAVDKLTLVDVVKPDAPAGFPGKVDATRSTSAAQGRGRKLVADRPDVIFHLAAVVSGEAETDFEKGYRINLVPLPLPARSDPRSGGGYHPKLVFTSSIAVFGSPFPSEIPDDFFHTPLTSYGAQKGICELLLADYTRKGFLDGVGIRLPTICVRPGKPNKAASGFFSNIIREPLAGQEAVLPVQETVMHWHASPRSAVGFPDACGRRCRARRSGPASISPCRASPARSASRSRRCARVAGDNVVARIRREPDAAIMRIVVGLADAVRRQARACARLPVEDTFDEIIRAHIDDELGGKVAA